MPGRHYKRGIGYRPKVVLLRVGHIDNVVPGTAVLIPSHHVETTGTDKPFAHFSAPVFVDLVFDNDDRFVSRLRELVRERCKILKVQIIKSHVAVSEFTKRRNPAQSITKVETNKAIPACGRPSQVGTGISIEIRLAAFSLKVGMSPGRPTVPSQF